MENEFSYEKYSKLSVASLVTGMLAVIFCVFYFLVWTLFDEQLTSLVSGYEFMSYILFSYVITGVCLTITAIITGSIDLKKIKSSDYGRKGMGLDLAGIILGSILVLFGLMLWFVDFFGFVNII